MASENTTQNMKNVYFFCTDSIVEQKSDKGHFVTGYITTDDVDLYGEVVTESAIDGMIQQLKSGNIKLDIDHSQFEHKGDIPIGRIVEVKKIREDGKTKIWVKCKLNSNHSKFNEVWKSIGDKMLDSFSIAYNILKKSADIVNDRTVTLLEQLDLINVAITGNPVNRGASMTSSFKKAIRLGEAQIDFKESGAHNHTEDNPGNHSHEAYELVLTDLSAKMEDSIMRIRWLEQDIRELTGRLDGKSEDGTVEAPYKSNKKNGGMKSMTEENNEPIPAPVAGNEGAPAQATTPAPAQAPAEPAKVEPEAESEELKSLKAEVDSLKKTNEQLTKSVADLTKKLGEPVHKAQSPDGKKSVKAEESGKYSPLSMIR